MGKFIFVVSEVFQSKFMVEASDVENAIESFSEGNVLLVDKSTTYSGINESEGYKGILEIKDEETQEVFSSPEEIEELAFKKTHKGERLYTLNEAKAILETKKTEETQVEP